MKFKIYIIVCIVGFSVHAGAQQLPNYSQHDFNKFLINPSFAGSEGYTSISAVAREQWLGIKNGPRTHAISIQSRILPNSFKPQDERIRKKAKKLTRSGKVGWGGYIFNDKNGLVDRTGLKGTYSYHINLYGGQLSFGLSGMVYQLKMDYNRFVTYDEGVHDELLNSIRHPLYVPDADFGVSFAQDYYYAGFSIEQIMQSSIQFGPNGDGSYRLHRQYNLHGGYLYVIDSEWSVEPLVWLKFPESTRPQLDITTTGIYKNQYWAGFTYRTNKTIIGNFGLTVDRYYFGYAYEHMFNSIMSRTYGSHELMVTVKFGDNARRYKWLDTY
jgi:type IX secretion system PorP/SprF family membrane protein